MTAIPFLLPATKITLWGALTANAAGDIGILVAEITRGRPPQAPIVAMTRAVLVLFIVRTMSNAPLIVLKNRMATALIG